MFVLALAALTATPLAGSTPTIAAHDNLHPAGRREGTAIVLRLVADTGPWQPEGPDGLTLTLAAFGEEGKPLTIPGPLVRVEAGTEVAATVRNALTSSLSVRGLCSRPSPCEPLTIPAGATREVRFTLKDPGTFHYWGTTTNKPLALREEHESQLGGIIVVDPSGTPVRDRIFLITLAPKIVPGNTIGVPFNAVAINGQSWPHTSRLDYKVGDDVRWRVVNLSNDSHGMHLHGFYFTVDSVGNGLQDQIYSDERRRTSVTEAVQAGGTFTMRWVPDRAGQWVFHCHMTSHMTPSARGPARTHDHTSVDDSAGMAGLVIGIRVTGTNRAREAPSGPVRKLALAVRQDAGRYGAHDGFRFDLEGVDAPRVNDGPVPGPVLVLTRGEPVAITIRNHAREATAVHWHGIELDSYFDGVPGWGGHPGSVTPPVAPGGTFVAKFTPPRAGTFIYHTHWHDEAQLAGGLYGALIVLEPGQKYSPETDHVVMIGLNGAVENAREPFAINGQLAPRPIALKAGLRHRLRLINITPNNVNLNVFLTERLEVSQWRLLAKDGADVPASQSLAKPARQLVSVGETYDFEWYPETPRNGWLEVRRGNGEWVLQAPIVVR
jgi:FtsP/CotA-like multicopper oxidase with cupredoxin domain